MRWCYPILLLAACRGGIGQFSGTTPRPTGTIRIALRTTSENAEQLTRRVFASDARVEIAPLGVTAIPADASLDTGRLMACNWARENGFDYVAAALYTAAHGTDFVCLKQAPIKWFVTRDEYECLETKQVDLGSTAHYALELVDAKDCIVATEKSFQRSVHVNGEEAVSLAPAVARLEREVIEGAPVFPGQFGIGSDGRIAHTEYARDGMFALFRGEKNVGLVRVSDIRGPAPTIETLECCSSPRAGDFLVERGPIYYYLDVAAPISRTSVSVDGERGVAYGASADARLYPVENGLAFGLAAGIVVGERAHLVQYTGDVGWSVRIGTRVHLSANLGAGLGYAANLSKSKPKTSAFAPHAIAKLHAIVQVVRWLYVGADVGYTYSATYHERTETSDSEVSLRAPVVDAFFGFY
jgi:hypothetical protein